ncbi:hypothetical protein [Streptomyces sp. NPDC048489]|uniref:hypothetical protein n=1 Tax=Streptomyces sp. NPDC048489 TaxID=3154504 RepID=UPI0034439E61
MAQQVSGRGRVTIFRLLHLWQEAASCVVAYTTTDEGLTGVLGVIPVEGNVFEPGDLFAVAGRHGFIGEWKGSHEERCACWLACTGYGSRTTMKPGTLDLPDAAWSMDMTRTVEFSGTYYGHSRVTAGRFALDDADLMERARGLLVPQHDLTAPALV